MEQKIEKVMKALASNNMEPYFVKDRQAAVELVKTLINKGDTVSCGGSESLKESGVMDLIKNGDYNFLDREKAKTPAEIEKVYADTFKADAFFCSANAVTEDGCLYNVDGRSNRVAAIVYGPKSVICIVGINKLVKDIPEAVKRVKTVAAPLNTKRLNMDTPCAKTGICCMPDGDMGTGCKVEGRICASFVVSSYQRVKNRIKVIICGENLGY